MTQSESRTLSYAIAGSLAVHLLLAVAVAIWIGVSSFHQYMKMPKPEPKAEVTLVFPEPLKALLAPAPPKVPEKYIRTTQNTEAPEAPARPDFISDRNTTAMTRTPPKPGGTEPMPTLEGGTFPTRELANRTFKDGDLKDDSAVATPPGKPSPPPTLPKVAEVPPVPAAPLPEPPKPEAIKPREPPKTPKAAPVIVKKVDSPAEQMMKELDDKLTRENPRKVEPPSPQPKPDLPPAMRDPDEPPIPKAIPLARPVEDTARPEANAFQPETRVSNARGSISNVGREDAVAAAATPAGRYKRQVTSAIEKKWHQYRIARADAVEPGRMGLRFYVNKSGKVEDLTFLFKQSNPLMEDFTIEAILKAEIPPIPKDLLLILDRERLEMTYEIVIHP